MPLDLTKELPDDDYVIFGSGEKTEKLFVTVDLPREFIKKFSEMKDLDDDVEKATDSIEQYLKDMFYLRNDKEKVDRLIKSIGYTALIKISNWYNLYVQEVMQSEEKKK